MIWDANILAVFRELARLGIQVDQESFAAIAETANKATGLNVSADADPEAAGELWLPALRAL